MLLSTTVLLLAILPFTLAQACTESSALSWPPSSNSTNDPSEDPSFDPSSDDTGCAQQYSSGGSNNPDELHACYCLAGVGTDCGSVKMLKGRAFSCTGSETCYVYSDGTLFCLDTTTGDYTDESGVSGNVDTGVYTDASGQVTIILDTETATDLTGASTAVESSSVSRTGTANAATATSIGSSASRTFGTTKAVSVTTTSAASTSGTTTSATVATTTSKAGGEKLGAGSVVGALGLVVGLVL